MKYISLLFIAVLFSVTLFSQGVAINNDGSSADGSAILDVSSTESGLLIPRMTEAQRDLVSSPAAGLMIYQTDNTPGFYYNSGDEVTPIWEKLVIADDVVGGTGAATRLAFWETPTTISSDSKLYWDNSFKRLGIGTSSPNSKLSIFDNANSYNAVTISHFSDSNLSKALYVNKIQVLLSGDDGYAIYGNADAGAGNSVGVYGRSAGSSWTGKAYGVRGYASGDGTNYGLYGYATGTKENYGVFGYAGGGFKNYAGYFAGDGYFLGDLGLGITTMSPEAQLHTTGTIRFENYTDGLLMVDADGNVSVSTGSGLFTSGTGLSWSGTTLNSVWTQSGDDIYNNNSENVGIGTSSPTALMHVNGTGTGEGNVLFSGLYKSVSPGDPPASGSGTRMMWYPDKAAFRVGQVTSPNWDKDSIGNSSFAAGFDTKATGWNSFACGERTFATGGDSFVAGYSSIASGNYSFANGREAIASGYCSFASGRSTSASGYNAFVSGWNAIASGEHSFASGYYTTASGMSSFANGSYSIASAGVSFAIGSHTTASANYSFATGSHTVASGNTSVAMGHYTNAPSYNEFVIGSYNTIYTPISATWNATDRLFVIGNGESVGSESDAMVILKNGKTGIGTSTPAALFHVNGTGTGEGNVLFNGSYKSVSPGDPPASGSGTRMMWYPDKAAFRAGGVSGTEWDKINTGDYSFAAGNNCIASGFASIAMGGDAEATDTYCSAIGYHTRATSTAATAIGYTAEATSGGATAIGSSKASSGYSTAIGGGRAEGYMSTAIGTTSYSRGNYSSAIGRSVEAISMHELALGSFNTLYTPLSAITWEPLDRIFVLGNGSGSSSRSDAMVILKNGNTGIGTSTPSTQLHTTGGVRFENYTDGCLGVDSNGDLEVRSGSTLFTDGNGLSWTGTTLNSVWTQTGTDISNNNTGNIGVGTTTPLLDLDVRGKILIGDGFVPTVSNDDNLLNIMVGISSDGSANGIAFYENVSGFAMKLGYDGAGSGATNKLAIYSDANTELVTFQNGGNVGMGVTAPSYKLQLSTNSAAKPTSSAWTIASDGRLKTNIHEYHAGLDSLMMIKPIWFTYTGEAGMPQETGVGVIAQDLQEVAPYMVSEWTYIDENSTEKTYLAVDNGAMTYMLINSVQEQQVLIDELIKQNEELIHRIEKLEEK